MTPWRILLLLFHVLAVSCRAQDSLRRHGSIQQDDSRGLEIEEYPIQLEPFHLVYHHHPRRDQSFEAMEEMDVLTATRNYLVQILSQEQPTFQRLLLYLFIREEDEFKTKVAYSGTSYYSYPTSPDMRKHVQEETLLGFLGENKTEYLLELTRHGVFDIDSVTLLNVGGHVVGLDTFTGQLLAITSPPSSSTILTPTESSTSSNHQGSPPPNTEMSSTVSMTLYLCAIIIPLVVFAMIVIWWIARKLRFDVVWKRPTELNPESDIWHSSQKMEKTFFRGGSAGGSQRKQQQQPQRATTNHHGGIPTSIVTTTDHQDTASVSTTTLSTMRDSKPRKLEPPAWSSARQLQQATLLEKATNPTRKQADPEKLQEVKPLKRKSSKTVQSSHSRVPGGPRKNDDTTAIVNNNHCERQKRNSKMSTEGDGAATPPPPPKKTQQSIHSGTTSSKEKKKKTSSVQVAGGSAPPRRQSRRTSDPPGVTLSEKARAKATTTKKHHQEEPGKTTIKKSPPKPTQPTTIKSPPNMTRQPSTITKPPNAKRSPPTAKPSVNKMAAPLHQGKQQSKRLVQKEAQPSTTTKQKRKSALKEAIVHRSRER
ncbi:expressed unknown protein [Seminavis robusta]|uniref:Uncharacterized protein n=1 Tax=Seminavis robusta TaxID=568900 RepID=A0A9N8DG07_9STRA|nr:expressed unknown protein [Seminavis robusta]|eukprot:Sro107_g053820.1 n/a (594) ;mRNA; r:46851-48632